MIIILSVFQSLPTHIARREIQLCLFTPIVLGDGINSKQITAKQAVIKYLTLLTIRNLLEEIFVDLGNV